MGGEEAGGVGGGSYWPSEPGSPGAIEATLCAREFTFSIRHSGHGFSHGTEEGETPRMPNDPQVVEIAGRHWLIGQLMSFGLEVAQPVRDRGVDLIVYNERRDPFWSVPVQVKAASYRSFSINKKYDKTPGLLLAYVWNVRAGGTPSAYVLNHADAIGIATEVGFTKTPSWKSGSYSTTNPSKQLTAHLSRFASTEERWWGLVEGRRLQQGT